MHEKNKGVYDRVCEYIRPHLNKDMEVLEFACGFRVIIMTRADSNDEYRILASLQKNKIEKVG